MADAHARCRHVHPLGHAKAGQQCGVVFGLGGSGYCITHDPERAEEALEIRQKGGRATAERFRDARVRTVSEEEVPGGPPTTALEARLWASWATWALAVGKIDARTAKEIGGLVRAFLAAHDKAELEGEIQKLRHKVRELEGDKRARPKGVGRP